MHHGWVMPDVAHLVERLPRPSRRCRRSPRSMLASCFEAAESDGLAGAWYLALSGLRRGEFCGLTWANVDLRPHW